MPGGDDDDMLIRVLDVVVVVVVIEEARVVKRLFIVQRLNVRRFIYRDKEEVTNDDVT